VKYSALTIILMSFLTASCVSTTVKPVDDELLRFAKANCFFAYFKKKNYDLKDIRAISGGIVEMGAYSAEKYQAVAGLIKEFNPEYSTKHNIDNDLLKCFKLDSDPEFMTSLNRIKNE